ncbi:MAG: ribonuclease HII [Rikenellaceae bacterium]
MLICCPEGFLQAGVDEAGRGPIAGPVVAAAVILPSDFRDERIQDSKKMTERVRLDVEPMIKSAAVAWSVAFVSEEEIDRVNILSATFLAMERAIRGLGVTPEELLIDGNRFRSSLLIPYTTVVGGDNKHLNIAAASILAKNARDRYMRELHSQHPEYCWDTNSGYPTAKHLEAIAEFGITPHHRKTFKGVREWVGGLF